VLFGRKALPRSKRLSPRLPKAIVASGVSGPHMKTLLAKLVLVIFISFTNELFAAQDVYVTRGSNGPVFSDQPQPGAKAVTLRPLNIVSPPSGSGWAAPASDVENNEVKKPETTAIDYRKLSVVFPENNGSVLANNALFEVRLAVDPPLLLGEGHVFVVSINGRLVSQRFTATEFMVPPEFWGDQLPAANQPVQLDVAIVDRQGSVLKQAAPVQFFMRYAVIHQRPAFHLRSSERVKPLDSMNDRRLPSQAREPRKTGEGKSQLPVMDR